MCVCVCVCVCVHIYLCLCVCACATAVCIWTRPIVNGKIISNLFPVYPWFAVEHTILPSVSSSNFRHRSHRGFSTNFSASTSFVCDHKSCLYSIWLLTRCVSRRKSRRSVFPTRHLRSSWPGQHMEMIKCSCLADSNRVSSHKFVGVSRMLYTLDIFANWVEESDFFNYTRFLSHQFLNIGFFSLSECFRRYTL